MAIKALADGQLPSSKGTLYTVPPGATTIIVTITLVNTDSAARTVDLYLNRTGTSRRIISKDLSIAAGNSLEHTTRHTMEAGDLLEGDASAATVVDYTVDGTEETDV